MIKVLVVGQTPPPYLGQAMMIQRLVNASFDNVKVIHIRLAFSEGEKNIGKFSFKKIFHLFFTIYKIYKLRFFEKDLILYYPPAGPNLTPIIRDLILLLFIRPIFKKTVFHFRAAGISEYLDKKSHFFQFLCKKIYGKPLAGIQLSSLNPKDALYFQAKHIFYIPNGLEDDALNYFPLQKNNDVDSEIKILFVGILREDKGLTYLIEALNLLLKTEKKKVKMYIMGQFNSEDYRKQLTNKISQYKLNNVVEFVGSLTGKSKWDYFAKADFLCFPTYFNSESFGNVLIEAMMFQLPVIATAWRGIPDIVTEETGFIVPIKNSGLLAEKISFLINNPTIRLKMGENARKRFLENYSLKKHLTEMESVFLVI